MESVVELSVTSHLGAARLFCKYGEVNVELFGRSARISGDKVEIFQGEDTTRLILWDRGCVVLLLTDVKIVQILTPFVLNASLFDSEEDHTTHQEETMLQEAVV